MAGALRAVVDATRGIPPTVTEETAVFWDAARDGRLVVERCSPCGAESLPPPGICRAFRSRRTAPAEAAGPGVVSSFAVNHQRWPPDVDVPYAVAPVEFPDHHPGVRVAGRLRGLLGAPGTGWDVAWAAAFLASDEARWITGVTLPVDSGVLSVTPLMMAQHLRAVPEV